MPKLWAYIWNINFYLKRKLRCFIFCQHITKFKYNFLYRFNNTTHYQPKIVKNVAFGTHVFYNGQVTRCLPSITELNQVDVIFFLFMCGPLHRKLNIRFMPLYLSLSCEPCVAFSHKFYIDLVSPASYTGNGKMNSNSKIYEYK